MLRRFTAPFIIHFGITWLYRPASRPGHFTLEKVSHVNHSIGGSLHSRCGLDMKHSFPPISISNLDPGSLSLQLN